MEKDISFRIADLITGSWSGSLTPAEEKELSEWRNASARNETLYQTIVQKKALAQYLKQEEAFDYQSRLNDLKQQIKKEHARRINPFLRRLAYAAAILLPLLSVALYVLNDSPSKETAPQSFSDLQPGTVQAQLVLPDGRTVQLNHSAERDQQLPDGGRLVNDTLSYLISGETSPSTGSHTLNVPSGGEFFIRLADGSAVWLNAGSQLTYTPSLKGEKRVVNLTGEAYFEVTPDSLRPFVVACEDQKITVLGTSFGVRNYPEEEKILTTLESGKVRVETRVEEIILHPGFQSVVSGCTIEVREVNTAIYTSWRSGKYVFDEQSLEEILSTIARWYNFEIRYETPEIKELKLTGELKRYDHIQEFLENIEQLGGVKFSINENIVTVRKN